MPGTLQDIRTKVRRLTRNLSPSQISDAQIDNYINTFILYDFPENLRLFSLRRTLTFYTAPFVDVYETTDVDPDDPLFEFSDRYITVHEPVYIGGYKVYYSQSRTEFFNQYPFVNMIVEVAQGDGVTVFFNDLLANKPVLPNNVTFNYIDIGNESVAIKDRPLTPQDGALEIATGVQAGTLVGNISYVTGAWTLNLLTPPAADQPINCLSVPYKPARPMAMLYFDHKFTLRPVPNQAYPVNLEVYVRPVELIENDQEPILQQWWQYIAYGAAKKIFEDSSDLDSVSLIMPGFKEQERLVLRTTLVQMQDQRTATIYTDQTGLGAGPGSWGWGWNNF